MIRRVSRAAVAVWLVVSAAALAFTGTARADSPQPCMAFETAYGITGTGALVVHAYCIAGDAAGRQASREAAPAGWWQGGAVFTSGAVELGGGHQAVAVYQVAPDGRLLWYGDDGQRLVAAGTPVGTQFGDWRLYRSLFSTGSGDIFGIDPAGQVLGWRHWGYPGADESWMSPWVLGSGFTTCTQLVGRGDSPRDLFGTDRANPLSITYWSTQGRTVAREPIVGRAAPSIPTWVDANRGYGRAADGRIARLTASTSAAGTRWVSEALGSDRYVRVFAGGVVPAVAVDPYEWQ
jgi:hypothetical protein